MKPTTINLLIILSSFIFFRCGDDPVTPPSGPPSDLTRSGKFISFTSNLAGNYDIYIAQVSPSGVLDTTNLVYPLNSF